MGPICCPETSPRNYYLGPWRRDRQVVPKRREGIAIIRCVIPSRAQLSSTSQKPNLTAQQSGSFRACITARVCAACLIKPRQQPPCTQYTNAVFFWCSALCLQRVSLYDASFSSTANLHRLNRLSDWALSVRQGCGWTVQHTTVIL
jgi:hypothetical protein